MLKRVRHVIPVFSDMMLDVLSANKTCVGVARSGDIQGAIAALKEAGSPDTLVGLLPSAGTLTVVDARRLPPTQATAKAHAVTDFHLRAGNSVRRPDSIGFR